MNTRVTTTQKWYLHATKGWRRGPKETTTQPVMWAGSWPRVAFSEAWERFA